MLSVIVPAFNEQGVIENAWATISEILDNANIEFELLFVDDGSRDKTWEEIREAHTKDIRIKGIRFSRNFGKDPAIFAGLSQCNGECAVVIDCDLQHPPQKIVDMYKKWEEGNEVVEGKKNSRGDEGYWHKLSANLFYKILTNLSNYDMKDSSDFKLLDRKVINHLVRFPEHRMFFRALPSWMGYKTDVVYYDVQERCEGTSKWSTFSLVKYAISNIAAFTTKPMQLVTVFGIGCLFISFFIAMWSLVDKLSGNMIDGITTVILLLLVMCSVIMISLGIMGYYISRIYEEVQNRPQYIVTDIVE